MAKLENMLPYIVRDYLARTEKSQTELAQEAKLNPSTISNMLRKNPRRIDLDTVEALQKIIGFNENDLIKRMEEFTPVASEGDTKRRNAKRAK